MENEIIVAVLSLIGTFLGSISGVKLMTFRIEQLEKKVERQISLQGSLTERMAVAENNIVLTDRRLAIIESAKNSRAQQKGEVLK